MSLVLGLMEGTDCMEQQRLYANHESWKTASGTNGVLFYD